ncbi:hypothetical protein [Iodobacter fluviatilis]|uniref:Uncharacterized protein n=1 Tax=Iodobacter fluviatilis TaxID=537 RepID=A0A377Q710_9NEIS|nr:hypothetical protein [Iodobacter fluviatilis]TCU89156.1 hypothetical protein EV682_10267 [Iodobacter fluviatilis]STQ90525.1 Uncharacterised protein [Iodobacter fluviatilis]
MKNPQKGMATVLILIFVGLALGATVLGANYYVKGMQEQQNTSLAATQAQMRAWQGLDIAQAVFNNMTAAQLQTLATAAATSPQNITLTGVPNITLQVTSATAGPPSQFNIVVTGLAGTSTSLASSSRLAASIVVTPGTPPVRPSRGVVMFNSDLKLGGAIQLFEGDVHNMEIRVNGNVETSGNSITGVGVIRSTGNITITSGSSFGLLHANGNITLTGSTSSKALLSRGNILLDNNGTIPHAAANGNITVKNSTEVLDLLAGGALDITNGGAKFQSGYQTAYSFNPATDHFEITTLPQFDVASGYTGATGKPQFDKVKLGIKKPGDWFDTSMISVVPDLIVNVPIVTLTPDDSFDAYAYKDLANYAFYIDDDGFMKVKVKRISGIAEGDYYIGSFGTSQKDYLCTNVSGPVSAAQCTGRALDTQKTICEGFSSSNSCFSYDSSKKLWTINGKGIAPGVAWFEGHLAVQNGTYYNTFITTLNFKTTASATIYAPNYAGYSGKVGSAIYSPLGYCNQTYYGLIPSQFCASATNWNSDIDGGIGNFSTMAGSTLKDVYQGGDISFANSSDIYGSVWAGNLYGNTGDTKIHGYITALALGSKTSNTIQNSTKIILTNLPDSFKADQTASPPGGGGSGSAASTVVRWVRYI